MSFSNTLKDLLNENNISQSRLASAIGFSQRALSKWINAQSEPTEKAITLCAEYFGVSADYLLGLSDDLGAPIPAPPPALPADEKELLDLYRQLNYEGKQRLLARAEVMIEDAQQQQNKSKRHA